MSNEPFQYTVSLAKNPLSRSGAGGPSPTRLCSSSDQQSFADLGPWARDELVDYLLLLVNCLRYPKLRKMPSRDQERTSHTAMAMISIRFNHTLLYSMINVVESDR